MGASQSSVEINGVRYDGRSGKVIGRSKKTGSIDGVVTGARTLKLKAIPNAEEAAKTVAKSKPARSKKIMPAGQVHRRTHKSSTLKRETVKKPAGASVVKPDPSMARRHEPLYTEQAVLATAASRDTPVNQKRLIRAKQQKIHVSIKRFGAMPAPSKIRSEGPSPSKAQAKVIANQHKLHILPSTVTTSSHAQLSQMLKKAMDEADSHAELPEEHTSRKRRRPVSFAMATLALALLLGFFAYQNIPNMAVQIAAKRSGVEATLPDYKPSGFAFSGPIEWSANRVTIHYSANSDNSRGFSITQRQTDWNNQALLSSFVSVNGRQYQTIHDRGKTIYVYDGQNATWLDNGIWYTLQGNASLSPSQLQNIVFSL